MISVQWFSKFLFRFFPQKLGRYSVFCVQLVPMETLNNSILISLLNLAQADTRANVQVLANDRGESRVRVARGLGELADEGLIDPQAIRLTFVGLMHASGLRARHLRAEAERKRAAAEQLQAATDLHECAERAAASERAA
jgi:hypothetical protein